MHANIHELLSLRDAEPVETRVAQHVGQCAHCTSELQQLSASRARLQALPQVDAPDAAWAQVHQEIHARSSAKRRLLAIAAAAAIAPFAVIIVTALREDHSPQVATTRSDSLPTSSEQDVTARVADLVAQSRELEQLLQALPDRPLIERVSTAATIDTIEHRIQWLDYQLSYAPDEDLSDAQSQRLWRERVDLMDSLVKVRYAEANRSSF